MLTTKTKISLASLAYKFIATGRAVAGKNNCATVRRRGLMWSLDLSEGIDFSIYLLGAFERSTVITLEKLVKPGDVVFDIGANIGAHTLGLARSVGPTGGVFAFEPTDFAFDKLKRNLALNPELQARTHPRQILLAASAAGDAPKEIFASWPLEEDTSVHPKHRGRPVTARNAAVDTLDRFVAREGIERLNVIKIDVDGHELPVLQGGLAVLTKFRPVLVMELSPYVHAEEHNSFPALVALLRDAGYSIQHASTWAPLPLKENELEALIPDGASINVIARSDVRP
ncbi:MAG TPA: FkbM family methyltransferase [Candidatus Acidoferrum sp.]|jgi:FkbM family methyltransferase|nr:FkbM family methyltransferase [Candidatus Acidoferrum sp.]